MSDSQTYKLPHLLVALIPFILLLGLMALMVYLFGSDTLGGASQIALLMAAIGAIIIGTIIKSGNFENFEVVVVNQLKSMAIPLLMLLLIGALSGSWMISGVVPTLVYYGVELLHPSIFLVATAVICAIVSLTTGSSWTTIATIGLALMGVGKAHGYDSGWIAGAIISGAYFGDKLSPLSDTTLMSSSVTSTPLFVHIRYMLITTIPTFIIALIVFTIVGFTWHDSEPVDLTIFREQLAERFFISPWLLLVPLITAILIAKRFSSLVILTVSMLTGGFFALIFQPNLLIDIGSIAGVESGIDDLFRGFFTMFFGETSLAMPTEELTSLVGTRGMSGMLSTIWLIICAMVFGAAMNAYGFLGSITAALMRLATGRTTIVATTVVGGILMNATTADQYVSIMLTGNMFTNLYRKEGFESRLLSRTIEDGVTVTSVLVPWNSCSMVQSSVLNVSAYTYIPYCIFNYLSPIMSILIARIGYKIYRVKPTQTTPEVVD